MTPDCTIPDNDVAEFHDLGYLILPGAVPAGLIGRWRQLAQDLEQRAMREHAEGQTSCHYCVVEDPVGPRLMRFDDVFLEYPEEAIQLLATPAMMAVARQLCGVGAVPMQMDILYKHQHPHPVINWHQGAPHPRGYPYLNIGIYLDDAPAGDGCLRYVPGTQHELQDIQGLSEQHGWELPGVVEQPANAGDILVQDMMILHGSQPKRSEGCRRTIYIELRPVLGIEESGAQSSNWADLRKQWMAQVLRVADVRDVPEDWREYYAQSVSTDLEALVTATRSHAEAPIPAVWAMFPVDHPEYPVPADLRT